MLSSPTVSAGSEEADVYESGSITALHQSGDAHQRDAPHRTRVTHTQSTEHVSHCWDTVTTLSLYPQPVHYDDDYYFFCVVKWRLWQRGLNTVSRILHHSIEVRRVYSSSYHLFIMAVFLFFFLFNIVRRPQISHSKVLGQSQTRWSIFFLITFFFFLIHKFKKSWQSFKLYCITQGKTSEIIFSLI